MARRMPREWIGPALAVGGFAAVLWAERQLPLRRRADTENARRVLRNMAMAGLTAAAVQLADRPLVVPLARLVERRGWGLLGQLRLGRWSEAALALLLMDYTLYLWHVCTHRVPLLWRFHLVHHTDLDLDASTALRFHLAEFLLSAPWRAAQVLLIGVSPRLLTVWQRLTLASVVFHHSNLRLPIGLERRLNRWIVTPRMHGIHHSIVREETDSNWSSGLTLWDALHGTLRLDVPQDAVTVGVPAYRDPRDLTLPQLLRIPVGNQRPSWLLPSGEQPRRIRGEESRRALAC